MSFWVYHTVTSAEATAGEADLSVSLAPVTSTKGVKIRLITMHGYCNQRFREIGLGVTFPHVPYTIHGWLKGVMGSGEWTGPLELSVNELVARLARPTAGEVAEFSGEFEYLET